MSAPRTLSTARSHCELWLLATARDHPHLGSGAGPDPTYNHVIYSDEAVVEEVGDGHDHRYCGLQDSDARATSGAQGSASGAAYKEKESATGDHDDETIARKRRVTFDINQHNSCYMRLIADHRFFSAIGGGSVLTTTNRLVDILESANQVFKAANFEIGGTVQLAIRKMTIFNTTGPSATGETNIFATATTSSSTYLEQLSSINHGQYCLAHAFTYQDFQGGVLGLAYVGTICDGYGSTASATSNTGITTALNAGSQSATMQTNIVFAHEVGHNFGMSHDDSCTEYCAQPGTSVSGMPT